MKQKIEPAWLIDQLPRAKRPNALLTIALSPLPFERIAAQAWISPKILIDFLLGDDDLTDMELKDLGNVLDVSDAGEARTFLFDDPLAVCPFPDEIEDAIRTLPEGNPLIDQVIHWEAVPYAAIFAAAACVDIKSGATVPGPLDKPRSKRNTRRRRKSA